MKKVSAITILAVLLSFAVVSAQVQQVTIENVTNTQDGIYLVAGNTHTVNLRVTNTGTTNTYNPSNGIRIFSNDGAGWTTTSGQWLNGFNTNFTTAFINPFSVSGSGADTIGFAGVSFGFPPALGIPAGYDDLAMAVTFGPTAKADHGKTICIDSTFFPPGGTWKWAPLNSSQPQIFPAWSGQQCYTVLDPDAPTGALVVAPAVLSFTAEEGGSNPGSQTYDVSDNDGTNVAFQSSVTPPWIMLTNPNGTTPGTVTVGVDIAGLIPGAYVDSIMVSASLPQSPKYVVVNLEITERPRILAVGPTTLNLSVMEGDPSPTARVGVWETGGDAISFETGVFPAVAWLTIPVPTGTTPDSFTVVTDITGLAPGPYNTMIQVASIEADNPPVNVYVNLEVLPAPKFLVVTPSALTFTWVMGTPAPALKTFDVTEQGGATIGLTATPSDDWISVNQLQSTTPGTVEVTVDPTGMPMGTSISSVVVSSAEAQNTPQTVTITLVVMAAPEFVVDPNMLNFSAVEGGANPAQQSVALSLSDGGTVAYSATRIEPWMILGNTDGATPAEITVDVDIAGLTPGIYVDSILIVEAPVTNGEPAYAAEITRVAVPVIVEITAAPRYLEINPDSSWYLGSTGAALPMPGSFEIAETGGDDIWFALSTEAPWLQIVGDSGVTPRIAEYLIHCGGLTPGNYYDSIKVVAGGATNSPVYHRVSLLVRECPYLIFDTSSLYDIDFTIFKGETVTVDAPLGLLSVGPTEIEWAGMGPNYFTLDPMSGTTPSVVQMAYSRTFDIPGMYIDSVEFMAMTLESDNCESSVKAFIRVMVLQPPSADTVVVGTVAARPGESVAVPIEFANSCSLFGLNGSIQWESEFLFLDSISYAQSAVADFSKTEIIDNNGRFASFSAASGGAAVPPKFGDEMNNWLNLHFTVHCDAPDGQYDLMMPMADSAVTFLTDCGEGTVEENPEIDPGYIMVQYRETDFCAWVVELDESGIAGATVELWTPFPTSEPSNYATSNGHGSFAMSGVPVVFDLWVHKDGYYPEHVENPVRGQKIYLTRVAALTPTSEWVSYYCGTNTFLGLPLPVGSVVEAKVGDLLVGRQYVTEAGAYRFLEAYRASTQFGDDGARTGDALTFYVNGQIAIADGDVIYPADHQTFEVCLEAGAAQTKECILSEGWNLVSWNVDTEVDDIDQVLADYMGDIEVVLGFEQGGLTYDPTLPQFSTLWRLDHLSGYWIKVKAGATVTLSITGFAVPVTSPIQITAGWNLVSYLPETDLTPAEALSSLESGSYLMFAYGFDTGGIQVYEPGGAFNQLTIMGGCNGYWIKSNNNAVLVYPDGDAPVTIPSFDGLSQIAAAKTPVDVAATTSWINLYSSNLTLDGQTVAAGAVITAHSADGDKVGSFTVTEGGLFGFMPVYAGDDAALNAGDEFYLAVDGVETTERFEWTENGARVEVLALSVSGSNQNGLPAAYSLHQNYPNPFNPTTVIPFSMPQAGHVKVEIYNVLGKLIAVPMDAQAAAGENNVEWDGRNAAGNPVASGVYLYRLTAGDYTETRKMMLLK